MDGLVRLRTDLRFYCRRCLKIRDKQRRIVPFVPNPEQERLIALVEDWRRRYPDERERPTQYIIILKARQLGFSTCTEAIFFHTLHFNFHTVAMVVSYDQDSARSINEMAGRFYQHLPAALRPASRPYRGKGLLFENPKRGVSGVTEPGLQSRFLIATAGNARAGSGYTLNCLHLSEVAKWPGDAAATMVSLLQAVPDRGGLVVIESTANGCGNHFHRLWQAARNGENGYIPLFVPWHAHTAYALPFGSAEARAAFRPDAEEAALAQLYNLSPEQLLWRRMAIRDKCGGDREIFRQEYPADDQEAFLASGRPRFDRVALTRMLAAAVPGVKGETLERAGSVEFVPEAAGYLTGWEAPIEGEEYIIGADVAEGLAHGDYSSADVVRRSTNAQVAHWHGRIDPDLFAGVLSRLARYYNRALVAPEVNNHGLTTVTALKRLYGRIYRRQTVDERLQNRTRAEYGWRTDVRTKPLMLDKLAACIREDQIRVPGRETILECLAYRTNDRGGAEAPPGGHDDRVISLAIAVYVNLSRPAAAGEADWEEPAYQPAFGRTNY